METKEIILPDNWEVKEVIGNKIIIKEKEKKLPKTWEECSNNIAVSYYPRIWYIPCGEDAAIKALCKLIICRDAWWNQLGWKPDWENCSTVKHCIQTFSEKVDRATNRTGRAILAFPTIETRDQFLETFRDLIEEAKELL